MDETILPPCDPAAHLVIQGLLTDLADRVTEIVDLTAERDVYRECLQSAVGRLAALTTQLERARTTIGQLLKDRRQPIGRVA